MSGPQVALPMYLGAPDAVQTLWTVLHQALTLEGLQRLPDAVAWPQELHAHWLSPDLLLSQTCGYPLTHALQGQVQLVGCFRYAAPGCEGIDCRSVLIARDEHAHLKLDSFRHLRVAFNSADSQSGYNALRAMVAPLATQAKLAPSRFRSLTAIELSLRPTVAETATHAYSAGTSAKPRNACGSREVAPPLNLLARAIQLSSQSAIEVHLVDSAFLLGRLAMKQV